MRTPDARMPGGWCSGLPPGLGWFACGLVGAVLAGVDGTDDRIEYAYCLAVGGDQDLRVFTLTFGGQMMKPRNLRPEDVTDRVVWWRGLDGPGDEGELS